MLQLQAKGFPDLATRRFLSILHSVRPELAMFALVDFDPYGVAILRTYKNGTRRFEHEDNVTVSGLRWLGIRSNDLLSPNSDILHSPGSSSASDSHNNTATSEIQDTDLPSDDRDPIESIAPLSQTDRKKAVGILGEICSQEVDVAAADQVHELQRMLMLNIKGEIQAVDKFGDITDWLDRRLSS